MEKTGWPKSKPWLRPIEDAESAELSAEEERIFEELGFEMSPLPEDELNPLEEDSARERENNEALLGPARFPPFPRQKVEVDR
ncbi:hypothetical protein IC757_14620 [Wenzhouxiangella sp. AB-CW3]|uniref:hypothetical protein n=1 Tax=Wenzhouxiangella sp. AB-CW3 TaxID=2771012 RepID=UPI00168A56A8|nr:hypothetical protein [Wenzhouxiangella sp. AB-CW3]QOC22234.1 hypothetical protein IC757_14620 [Wenzhouxiangella sp. AB-CW3]